MKAMKKEASRLATKHPRDFRGGLAFVMDNAKFHGVVRKKDRKEKTWKDFKIPPSSPEFNKPIEHVFNTVKSAFKRQYNTELVLGGPKHCISLARAKRILKQVIEKYVKPESIKKDVKSYKRMLREVIKAKGGHITKYN